MAREGLAALANGARLWFWDTEGAGDAVVFVHPHSGNHCSWGLQKNAFQAAGFRVIAYSRRGYYRSAPGPADDVGTQAGDLAELLDWLGIDAAHVIGSAAGGSSALDFALAFPERTLTAVIASSLMSIDEPDYKAPSARARGPWFDPLPVEARELSASFRAMQPEAVEEFLEVYALNGFQAGKRRVNQGLAARIDWATLGANAVPMLLMTGGADLYLPPALLRYVAPRVGASEMVVVPDIGHPIFFEAPDTFNQLVLDFIERRGRAKA